MRRSFGLCSLVAATVLTVSGCNGPLPPVPTAKPTVTSTPLRQLIAPPQAVAVATAFGQQLVARDYAQQWGELAPVARQMWPSRAARTAMLSRKFAHASLLRVEIAEPTLESTWTAPERPAVHVADVWSFPVRVAFADPGALRPLGVARLFSMTSLQIVIDPLTGTGQVVGEGPASMDAPIILPTPIPVVTVHVPILMYHLIDRLPPRSIEPSTFGWRIEIGLTTLPAAFDAQMQYLVSIHATSISLQHLADALLYGLPLPPHPFVITFDDGRLSPWTNAVQLLRAHGFTAVFFPCTGLIGGTVGPQTYMTATELQNLASTGFSIEDHTVNDATDLFFARASTLRVLTDGSKAVLEHLTGEPVQFISYSGTWPWPRTAANGTRETSLFVTLSTYGYIGGVQDLRMSTDAEMSSALWELPRVRIGLPTTAAQFAHWFSTQPA